MKNIITALCVVWLATACDAYETIEDQEMEQILTEALITNAIAWSKRGYPDPGTSSDTVDYYTPILRNYDYTLNDFRGTIQEMATRKSNPLAEIFTRVNLNLDSLAAAVEYRYRAALRYDSTALAYFADTLYAKDTMLRGGALSKMRLPVSHAKQGTYRLSFAYRSTEDYRVGSKSVLFHTDPKGPALRRFWIDRATRDTARFVAEVELPRFADTLVVSFEESKTPKTGRTPVRDTSFVHRLLLVYTPPVERARRDYMMWLFDGIDILDFAKPNAKDSLPIPFRR